MKRLIFNIFIGAVIGAVPGVFLFSLFTGFFGDTWSVEAGGPALVIYAPIYVPILIGAYYGLYRTPTVSKNGMVQVGNGEYHLYEFNGLLTDLLDQVLRFIDAYLKDLPDEYLILSVLPKTEKEESPTGRYTHYYEFVEIKVTVGLWYDCILCEYEKEKDYMESVFQYDPTERTFTYRIHAGSGVRCVVPRGPIVEEIYRCIDAIERMHPGKKLKRDSNGVYHSWHLSN